MNKILCFDIGGTFIKYAVVDSHGKISYLSKVETPVENHRDAIIAILLQIIIDIRKHTDIIGIGISVAGQVNTNTGELILASPNLPGFEHMSLPKIIMDATNLYCVIENDVNAAALGESWQGAGKQLDSFFCFALGTGIGGALILNKQLFAGKNFSAGEVGFSLIDRGNFSTYYEDFASTKALITRCNAHLSRTDLDGKKIMALVAKNDPAILEEFDRYLDDLIQGFLNVTYIVDPGTLIIGGGLSEAGDPFFSRLNAHFKKRGVPFFTNYTKIIPAKLGNSANLIGVASLFFKK